MKPKMIAFPVDDIHCQVWCPFCARWHIHGYDGEERRRWTHRVPHCGDKVFFPQGYWIKLASAKDYKDRRPRAHQPKTIDRGVVG